ncbi:MAG: CapA family protein [Eubacteriales bacterium]|jgi:poly-gamma-glutamate capsule biosynthesis protein CapA/YwtB (metallophosphatase superfamily)
MARRAQKKHKSSLGLVTLFSSATAVAAIALLLTYLNGLPTSGSPPEIPSIPSVSIQPSAPPEPVVNTARITVTGDLMGHEYQLLDAKRTGGGEYDFHHNFEDVKKYFDQADLVLGNLETTLCGPELGYSGYPNFGTPDAYAVAIRDAGFDVLSTANNHCMDKRTKGAMRTLDVLDELGLDHVGTYRSQEERDTIYMRDVNGIQTAILSYTYGTNGMPVEQPYMVNLLDESLIRSDIQKARQQGAELVIVMPHMGVEYETYARDTYQAQAHMMLEAGADIVFASHPHVLQPMEYVDIPQADGSTRTGFVIYSLGNAISAQETFPRNAGVLLNVEVQQVDDGPVTIEEVSFTPTWVQFKTAQGTQHFKIRSVYEMLVSGAEEEKATIRSQDIDRLKKIHTQTTKVLLGQEVPLENIQDRYIFPKP